MLRKKRKWPVIAAVIAAFFIFGIAGNLFVMSQHTQGVIELPAELPSREMMAHIAANLEQLSGPNSLFTRSEAMGVVTALDYADENGLSIIIHLDSSAKPEDVLAAAPNWQGQYFGLSDLMAKLSGSGKYVLTFVCNQGPLTLVITQDDASAISTTPLEKAIALIQSVVGTP